MFDFLPLTMIWILVKLKTICIFLLRWLINRSLMTKFIFASLVWWQIIFLIQLIVWKLFNFNVFLLTRSGRDQALIIYGSLAPTFIFILFDAFKELARGIQHVWDVFVKDLNCLICFHELSVIKLHSLIINYEIYELLLIFE